MPGMATGTSYFVLNVTFSDHPLDKKFSLLKIYKTLKIGYSDYFIGDIVEIIDKSEQENMGKAILSKLPDLYFPVHSCPAGVVQTGLFGVSYFNRIFNKE